MSKMKGTSKSDRREFLKLAGLGSVAGAAALVAGESPAQADEKAPSKRSLYRETDHVRKYYELSKF